MKIAIFHELDNGGARRAVDEYKKHLFKANEIDIYYVSEKKDLTNNFFSKNTFFYNFKALKYQGNDFSARLYKDTIELFKLYKLHKKIADDISKKDYDVVFIHPSKFTQAPFLLRFLKHSKVYYCQEPLRIVYDEKINSLESIPILKRPYEMVIRKARKFIDKSNLEKADMILSNSKYSKAQIEKAYGRKSMVCYLGVDSNFFKPLKIKKTFDLLYIGDKSERSGYFLLEKVLNDLKPRPIVRIIFRGKERLSEKELFRTYNSSKITLALSRNEPFGLIPLESMACGVPVIAINEGGFKESITDNETGLLVDFDKTSLSEAITTLLRNENLQKKMGRKSYEHVKSYWTWEKSTEKLLKCLKECAKKHKSQ